MADDRRHRAVGRLSWLVAGVCSLCVSLAAAQDTAAPNAPQASSETSADAPLPKKDEMLRNIPSKADLLLKPPVDWIILKKDEVLVVKPVEPRPRTLEQIAEKRKLYANPPKLTRMPGESQEDFLARLRKSGEETRKLREQYESLEVELPDNVRVSEEQDDSSYLLNIDKFVSEIIHFEELILRRVDLLLEASELEDAYELLVFLDRRHPGWPGYDERLNRFLLKDAQRQLKAGQAEVAFVLLEQMHARVKEAINSKDPLVRYATMGRDLGLCQAELGNVIDVLVGPAVKARDFRQARFHLARLMKLEPDHPNGKQWRDQLIAETQRLLAEASKAAAAGQPDQAASLAEEAALVWPLTPGLKNAHRQALQRWQILKVGIVGALQPATEFPFATEISRRREGLMRLPLFEPIRIDGGARYRSRFLENWEPTDLGRQAVFTLRQNRSSWESSPIVTASGAVTALLKRLDPESPDFDERLASFIDGVAVRGPFEFSVNFSRIPVRTEALFAMPLGTDAESSAELDQRFRVHKVTDKTVVLQRTINEPERVLQRHLAEVRETTYVSYDKAVQGLLRGEVSMLPNVPVWQLDQLAKDERFFVRRYAVPLTHFVQFNPHSKLLRSAELRRALMYGLDRAQILRDVVLRDLTVRTLSEPLPQANVPANLIANSGLTYDPKVSSLIWTGLSMSDQELRKFGELSRDAEYRKALLSLFKKSQPDRGRVVSAPWATNLSAYSSVVKPRESDLSLAFALATAAKKGQGGKLRPLRMICEPDPIVEAAAKRLIDEWKRIDIVVELVSAKPTEQMANPQGPDRLPAASGQDVVAPPEDVPPWDLVYRTMRMTEPMMELWPLLALDKVARVSSIRYLPDWLRQGLIDLDRTADWSTTVESLHKLHQQLAETVQFIPLWEVDDALVFRRTLRGIPDAPLHPYQDVELWIAEPFYSTE
jgi:hypothetical protein